MPFAASFVSESRNERNKALFDVSQQVFQNLNKIEQKNISAGKKYQQAFARKKRCGL